MDQWYSGDQGLRKTCPLCRGDRGFADTSQVLGIDDFLIGIGNAIKTSPRPAPSRPAVPAPPGTAMLPDEDTSDLD